MDVIIPYKDEVHKGLELRYALRSIEKNLTGWDRVYLIGQAPDWYKGLYVLPVDDYPGRKEYSVYRKLLFACDIGFVSENFIYWNDDHFLLKPLDVSEIKYWHNGPLEGRNVYNRELIKQQMTIALFNGATDLLNFDIHAPIIFRKSLFKKLFETRTEELCIKSYYKNHIIDDRDEFMEDCKIVGCFPKEEVEAKIKDRLFFSTNAICAPTVEVLEELFPEKSTFEI